MRGAARLLVATLGLALAAALTRAIGELPAERPSQAVDLRPQVVAHLDQTGVSHPVTAVLLDYRGYDTLLEVAVLALALIALLVLAGARDARLCAPAGSPLLVSLARGLVPVVVLTGGYLLWAGAHRPGGAFQAAAVLAAGAVLLQLAGLMPAWASPGRWLRLGLMLGFGVFLGVAYGLLGRGALLDYPPQWAGALILLIETGLTLSLGLTLAGLFLFLTERRGRP
ncbi:MAG: hypothetical protein NZ524_11545 [Thiobacillaceae bacterium]|nr:hypothetical protein [Thiobacillaceae bacterium]